MSCIGNCKNTTAIPLWIMQEVERIIKQGNTAEIKKERGEYVVIEIKRKLIKEN